MAVVSDALDAELIHTDYADTKKELERLTTRINSLIDLRLGGEITKEELQTKREPLDKQMATLEEKLLHLSKSVEMAQESGTILKAIKNRISSVTSTDLFREDLAKEVLDKIVIHSKTAMTFILEVHL